MAYAYFINRVRWIVANIKYFNVTTCTFHMHIMCLYGRVTNYSRDVPEDAASNRIFFSAPTTAYGVPRNDVEIPADAHLPTNKCFRIFFFRVGPVAVHNKFTLDLNSGFNVRRFQIKYNTIFSIRRRVHIELLMKCSSKQLYQIGKQNSISSGRFRNFLKYSSHCIHFETQRNELKGKKTVPISTMSHSSKRTIP